jgi:serine/threonine protein kinase
VSDSLGGLRAALSDRYAIEEELGHGGMGTVYRGRDLKHDRFVAIKVLNPELELARERFIREVRLAAKLQHPNILPVFDSGEAAGRLYYVMPLVEGESLRARLEREHQLPIEDAVQIGREVAEALAHAHSHGVVHRDIKPDNVVGYSNGTAISEYHATLWDRGAVTDLGTLPEGNRSDALGINDGSQIVAFSDGPGPGDSPHAVLWDHGVVTDLGPSINTGARAINSTCQITGVAEFNDLPPPSTSHKSAGQ